MKNVFIWLAHPRSGSLCESLADTYQAAAEAAGANVRRMNLSDMKFAVDYDGFSDTRALEPDLLAWQEAIGWADHILIIHPYWWGAMPTRAKAVLDRALSSGFAYKYHRKGAAWDKLLAGKTADAIITSDTPPLIDTLIYRKPGRRVLRNQVLGFCGIKAKHILQFGSVKLASPKKIQTWINRTRRMGQQAAS